MKHKYVRLIAFSLALLPSPWANGQQAVGTGAVSYLLRLERLQSGQDVCVLVQRNGQYHLERLHPYGIGVFEGKLPNGALTWLENLLTKNELFRLQQSDIGVPLVTGDLDQLFVSVLRPARWQNLEFDSAESRKPYEENSQLAMQCSVPLNEARISPDTISWDSKASTRASMLALTSS